MRLTVIGCSGSYPGSDAACSAYLVEHDGFRLLLDLGNGSLGTLQNHLDPREIDALYLSHLHGDHWLDLVSLAYVREHHPDGAAVVSYEQSPGFGGYLTIERPSGEQVKSYLGEKTDLECAATADGPFAACSKEHLVGGVTVAEAEHGLNDFGHDVWTRVYLVVPESTG